ncbi:MAG: G8 domain-containing protein, partial [bacterium]
MAIDMLLAFATRRRLSRPRSLAIGVIVATVFAFVSLACFGSAASHPNARAAYHTQPRRAASTNLNAGCATDLSQPVHRVPLKQEGHAALLALSPHCLATHTANQSGSWSAPPTWHGGIAPGPDARVHIPAGLSVVFDDFAKDAALEWVRVDGMLTFAHDRPTAMLVRSLFVTETGHLEIGSRNVPIGPQASAELIFAPRKDRNRRGDPFDLAGGLISHGVVRMFSVPKAPSVTSTTPLVQGVEWLDFAQPVVGWAPGDTVLFPDVRLRGSAPRDELIRIAAVTDGGRRVKLRGALQIDHLPPAGMAPIPVSNLTRSIVVRSERANPLADRGHVMFMHTQTGTEIDGAAFIDLGRTDAKRVHTLPRLAADRSVEEGTDANTIGRYAIHFHIRSGASIRTAPHVVRNSVIVGSPKHGLVNHGGHVIAEDNVTYNIAGAHFFAENGSEIGAFRRNIAVRSSGSGSSVFSRDAIYDFGHEGHGFWTQSAAVELTDNWAIGHSGGAFVIFGYPVREQGKFVMFDGRNAPQLKPDRADGWLQISSVTFRFARNHAGASQSGIEVWNHKIYAANADRSSIESSTVWDVAQRGIFLPYAKNLVIRGVKLMGVFGAFGVVGNDMTENIVMENLSVKGFATGVTLPTRGTNALRSAELANLVNIEIVSATKPDRVISIESVQFLPREESSLREPRKASLLRRVRDATRRFAAVLKAPAPRIDIKMHDLVVPVNGDAAMLFENDHLYYSTSGGLRRQLFFSSQRHDAVPFAGFGPEMLRGLTSKKIQSRFGIAIGGMLAPENARFLPNSNLLIADALPGEPERPTLPKSYAEELSGHAKYMLLLDAQYPGAFHHFKQRSEELGPETWVLSTVADAGGGIANHLVFQDTMPPTFILQPSLRKANIHPDDVQYGYRVGPNGRRSKPSRGRACSVSC